MSVLSVLFAFVLLLSLVSAAPRVSVRVSVDTGDDNEMTVKKVANRRSPFQSLRSSSSLSSFLSQLPSDDFTDFLPGQSPSVNSAVALDSACDDPIAVSDLAIQSSDSYRIRPSFNPCVRKYYVEPIGAIRSSSLNLNLRPAAGHNGPFVAQRDSNDNVMISLSERINRANQASKGEVIMPTAAGDAFDKIQSFNINGFHPSISFTQPKMEIMEEIEKRHNLPPVSKSKGFFITFTKSF